MPHPYENFPASAFWRSAVANRSMEELGPLWTPKSPIVPSDRVVTFGSCFAQHIGTALSRRGYGWVSTEPPPPCMSEASARRFNYNVFSCRVANIYTASMLAQWTRWALRGEKVPEVAWEDGGRWFDPFRPAIEPGGFESRDEMTRLRDVTIRAFAEAIETADHFVFTLGLTETWRHKQLGHEYSSCPGTVAGLFDSASHASHNLDVVETVGCLVEAFAAMRARKPRLRILLTVSPVPLAATHSGQHVLVATTRSKAILRAAADHLATTMPFVDYFPSYELITSPSARGRFFEPNMRQVSEDGVAFVMERFFAAQGEPPPAADFASDEPRRTATSRADVICEEELLEAFAPAKSIS